MASKDQLLAAAVQVIRTNGPEVTMDDIAAAADVTKPGTMNSAVPSKNFVSVLKFGSNFVIEPVEVGLPPSFAGTSAGAVIAVRNGPLPRWSKA